jgi:hypothetical protein
MFRNVPKCSEMFRKVRHKSQQSRSKVAAKSQQSRFRTMATAAESEDSSEDEVVLVDAKLEMKKNAIIAILSSKRLHSPCSVNLAKLRTCLLDVHNAELKCLPPASIRDNSIKMHAEKFLGNLKTTGCLTATKRNSAWRADVVGPLIFSFFELIEKCDTLRASTSTAPKRPSTEHPSVTLTRKLIFEATKLHEADQVADLSAIEKVVKKCKQEGSSTNVQDQVEFDPSKLSGHPCLFCNHLFMTPLDQTEVNAHNTNVRENYETEKDEYAKLSVAEKKAKAKPKPRRGLYKSVSLACMCATQHCHHLRNGQGCHECVTRADRGRRPQIHNVEGCTCEICKCQCKAFYPTDKSNSISHFLLDQENLLQPAAAPQQNSTLDGPVLHRTDSSSNLTFTFSHRRAWTADANDSSELD